MTQISRMTGSLLTASAFSQLRQYTSSHGRWAVYAQNLPFSSIAVAIAGTHCAYPRRDGQAEFAWVAGYIARRFTWLKADTHPTTNRTGLNVEQLADREFETNALPPRKQPLYVNKMLLKYPKSHKRRVKRRRHFFFFNPHLRYAT